MKKNNRTAIRIITTECAGLGCTTYIEDDMFELERAKQAFIEWNEPNSFFMANRVHRKAFGKWEIGQELCVMENK